MQKEKEIYMLPGRATLALSTALACLLLAGGLAPGRSQAGFTLSPVVALHSAKCLQLDGASHDNGAALVQWGCDGGEAQDWRLVPVGEYHEIVSRDTSKCLDVYAWDPSDGAAIVQWDCHGGDNQLWRFVPVGDDYEIVSKFSGKCLDVAGGDLADGAPVIQWGCHGGDNQLFANRWFDQAYRAFLPAAVRPVCAAPAPAPSWQILVLLYTETDFVYVDAEGTARHLVAAMTPSEIQKVTDAVTRFVGTDVPALNSCNMQPVLTIRIPDEPLSSMGPGPCNDYVPSPLDTAPDRDPAFDSAIVVWDGTGIDQLSGEPLSVAGCAYAWGMGTGQTYNAIHVDFVSPRDRNVFKHEWGHSILFYYDAAGTAPEPAVNNHINDEDNRYVNCLTGAPYILVDETDDNPIPNSIYHNFSGFTHDYYSGLTATADQPGRCLGIPPAAWASGGPVSRPAGQRVLPAGEETIGAPVP